MVAPETTGEHGNKKKKREVKTKTTSCKCIWGAENRSLSTRAGKGGVAS